MNPVYRSALRSGYSGRRGLAAQDLKNIAVSMFTNKGHADAMRNAEALCRAVPWDQLQASLAEDEDKGTWPLVGLFTEMLLLLEPDMTGDSVKQHVDVFCMDMQVLQPPHMARPPDEEAMSYFYDGIADHIRTYPTAIVALAPCSSSPVEQHPTVVAQPPAVVAQPPAVVAGRSQPFAVDAFDTLQDTVEKLLKRLDDDNIALAAMKAEMQERDAKYAADIRALEHKDSDDVKTAMDRLEARYDADAKLRDARHATDLRAVREEAADKFRGMSIDRDTIKAVSEATASAVVAAVKDLKEMFQFSAEAPVTKKPAARKKPPAAKKPAATKRAAEDEPGEDARATRAAKRRRS